VIVGGYEIELKVLQWATSESREIDGNGRIGGAIVAELTRVICSPRPEVIAIIDGEGVTIASGEGLELNILDWAAGESGEVDGHGRIGGRIVAKLTVIVVAPSPEVVGGIDGERMAVGGDGFELNVLCWVAGESGEVDGHGRIGGRIVTELAVIVCSPRPKVAAGVDGEGMARTDRSCLKV